MKKGIVFLWDMAAPLLFYEVVIFVVYIATAALVPAPKLQAWSLPVQALGAAAASILMLRRYLRERSTEVSAYASRFDTVSAVRIVLLGACLCLTINMIEMELPISWDEVEDIGRDLYSTPVPVQLLCVGMLFPAAEELVFRGLCYSRMRRILPVVPSVLLSAVYFGWYHGNFLQGLYAAVIGIFCAGLMEWYGTLKAAYLLHASANIVSVLVTNTVIGTIVSTNHMVRMIWISAGLLLLAGIAVGIRKDNGDR